MIKKINIVALIIVIGIIIIPSLVFGADGFGLNETGEGLGFAPRGADFSIRGLVIGIVKYLIGLIGVAAIVMILYGGVRWMTAGGSPDKVNKAKKIIINAAIGLAICIAAFAIVSFIQYQVTTWIAPGDDDDDDDGDGLSDPIVFIISDWDPEDGEVNLPRNLNIGIDFNQNIDVVSINLNQITLTQTVAGVEEPIDLEIEDLTITNRRIEIRAPGNCDEPNIDYCYDANAVISVVVGANTILSADDGESISCASSEYNCNISISVGELFDTEPPTVQVTYPINGSSFRNGQNFGLEAHTTDNVDVTNVIFYANGFNMNALVVEVQENSWAASWTLSGYQDGNYIWLIARAIDSSGNESLSNFVRIRQIPAHCVDGLQNEDETGLDCGGSCGACEGESCDTNNNENICDPNGDCAAELYCDEVNCLCEVATIITSISSDNGAVGNLVTINGINFGEGEGEIYFNNGQVLVPARIAECNGAWTDTQIIVVVPELLESGDLAVISVYTEGGSGDDTVNSRGWQGVFEVNDILRPGICAVTPPEGRAFSTIVVSGEQFGNTTDVLEVGGFNAAINDWTNTDIEGTIPNINPGTVGVRVLVDGEYSNVLNYTIAADDINPIIAYLNPAAGPVGQYVTIYGDNFGYDENAISITFGGVAADISFPTQCGAWEIDNNEILVKVPSNLALDTVNVVVTRNGYQSDPVNFTVNNDPLLPGLCLLEPNHGLPSSEINIYGEGFSNANGQVFFYNNREAVFDSWNNTTVNTAVVPLEAVTGPVQLENSADVISGNTLNFTVDICTESNTPPDKECCIDGSIADIGQCENNGVPGVTEDTWMFTTGVPFEVTDWTPTCDSACLNAAIQVNFSHSILPSSILNNDCVQIECLSDSCPDIDPTISLAEGNLVINYAGELQADSQYRVIVHTGEYNDGQCVLSAADGWPFVNVNYDTDDDQVADSFAWVFATSDEFCTLERVEVDPEFVEFLYQDNEVAVLAKGYGQPDSCQAEGQLLNAYDYDWDWRSANASLATLTQRNENFDDKIDPIADVYPFFNEATGRTFGDTQIITETTNEEGYQVTNNMDVSVDLDVPIITEIDPITVFLNPEVVTYTTIDGVNFGDPQGSSYVMVGNQIATIAGCQGAWSNNQIVIEVPAGTSTGDKIRVIKARGEDESDDVLGVLEDEDDLTVILCSINPSYGQGNTAITLHGYNFGDTQIDSRVIFNDDEAHYKYATVNLWANERIVGFVPSNIAIRQEPIVVFVNVLDNENGLDVNSNPVNFDIAPHIDYISPNNGPIGQYVTIYGRNFGDQSGIVNLGNTAMTATPDFCGDTWTNNVIVRVVPAGLSLSDYELAVTTSTGLTSNAVNFVLNNNVPGPNLCLLEPDNGDTDDNIVLSGDNFGADSDLIQPLVSGANLCEVDDTSFSNTNISGPITAGVRSGEAVVRKSYIISHECNGFHIGNWCPFGYTDVYGYLFSNSLPFSKLNSSSGGEGCSNLPNTCVPDSNICEEGLICNDSCVCVSDDGSNGQCGDGNIDADEQCENNPPNNIDGDGCSATCQNEFDDLVCGDWIIQVLNSDGVNEECDDGNNIDNDGCSATCQNENDDNIVVPVGASQCGNGTLDGGELCDFDTDGTVLWSDGEPLCTDLGLYQGGSVGCDPSDCSYDTAMCIYGSPSSGVCVNTEASVTFEGFMDSTTFVYGTDDSVQLESFDDEACSAGCLVSATLDFEISGEQPFSFRKLYIMPIDFLDPNTDYQVTLIGGDAGILSIEGNQLDSDFIWSFDTGSSYCTISRVEIAPASYQFNSYNDEQPFIANVYDQNNNSLHGSWIDYVWVENEPNNSNKLDIYGANSKESSISVFNDSISGHTFLNVNVSSEVDGISYGSASDQARIDIVVCDEPVEYTNATYNFRTWYCRDGSGDELLSELDPHESNNLGDNILYDVLYTQDGSVDGIGLRIYTNFYHYDPLLWYQENIDIMGSPAATSIDGYEAIQEGRSTYINAVNQPVEDIYTNIFVWSYTQNASPGTINLYNQLVNNLEFNTNIPSQATKQGLTRDAKRVADYREIKLVLGDGNYPALDSGSYLQHTSVSTWDSWQNALGAELGVTLPVDPLNQHVNCDLPGFDPITCWNQTTEEYSCTLGSRIYRYDYLANDSYLINMEFDITNSLWKGDLFSDIPDFFVDHNDCAVEPINIQDDADNSDNQ